MTQEEITNIVEKTIVAFGSKGLPVNGSGGQRLQVELGVLPQPEGSLPVYTVPGICVDVRGANGDPLLVTIDELPQPAEAIPVTMGSLPQPAEALPVTLDELPQPAEAIPVTMGSLPQPASALPVSLATPDIKTEKCYDFITKSAADTDYGNGLYFRCVAVIAAPAGRFKVIKNCTQDLTAIGTANLSNDPSYGERLLIAAAPGGYPSVRVASGFGTPPAANSSFSGAGAALSLARYTGTVFHTFVPGSSGAGAKSAAPLIVSPGETAYLYIALLNAWPAGTTDGRYSCEVSIVDCAAADLALALCM